jgi:hypothetical protein
MKKLRDLVYAELDHIVCVSSCHGTSAGIP